MARPPTGINRVTVGASILPEIDAELQAIEAVEPHSKSRLIEYLLVRGIAAYKRDGFLDEEHTVQSRAARIKQAASKSSRKPIKDGHSAPTISDVREGALTPRVFPTKKGGGR